MYIGALSSISKDGVYTISGGNIMWRFIIASLSFAAILIATPTQAALVTPSNSASFMFEVPVAEFDSHTFEVIGGEWRCTKEFQDCNPLDGNFSFLFGTAPGSSDLAISRPFSGVSNATGIGGSIFNFIPDSGDLTADRPFTKSFTDIAILYITAQYFDDEFDIDSLYLEIRFDKDGAREGASLFGQLQEVSNIPVPSSLLLFPFGLAGIAGLWRKRHRIRFSSAA